MNLSTTHSSSRGFGRYVVRGLALALAAGTLAVTQVAAPAFAADPVAGAQTAGDSLFPNQGNGGYDVSHYDINFRVDVAIATTHNGPSTTNLPNATATIDATTTGAPLSSYSFDFQGTSTTLAASTLNVDSVTVNGVPATFERIENTTIPDATTDKHKLVITPASPVSGEFTTVVKYSGQPVVHRDTDNSIEGWNNTVDGATFVNQPVGSMTLFPNNDTPRDKATYTWTVNAPTTLSTSNIAVGGDRTYQAGVVSNGELLSRTPSDDGTRTTWVWDQKEQQASELSFFSVGRYDIYTSDIVLASGRTIPEWTFIDPALSQANQATTLGTRAQLKALLDFYETKYGPYPGNSTGLVTDNTTGINYALETQDRPFFPSSASRGTTYHEIMHQWWGDAVAPTDWNDITLNEGPAQYSEFQFPYESAGSSTTTTEQQNFALYTSRSATSGTFAVAPAAMTDAGDLFGQQVYEKGSFTLEALRTAIGAADFETLMRQYQQTYGGGQISGRRTAAFEAMAESISGRDLSSFFQTWWFTSGKPAWPVKFNLDLAGPTTQVNAGDAVTYTLSARNTGKVAMPASGTVITVDLADVLDDASIGTLPAGTTLDGTTLTWTVPATALSATSSVAIPVTVNSATTGNTLKAVARASTLGGTCLDCAPSVTVGTAPISPAPVPTITGGTPTVGAPLTADTTGWADGTAFAYQWFVDGTPVPGATSASYTPTFDAVGLAATVKVTGTQAGFNSTSTTSAATGAIGRATMATSTPTIVGTPQAGQPLTVSTGTWTPGTVFTYAWRNNGTAITGATGPVYYPTAGQVVSVTVTGTRSGFTTASSTSAATDAVPAGPALAQTPTPVLDGTPKVGAPFEPSLGLWDTGTVLTFQWAANGTNVTGAAGTGATITPTAAQLGRTLTLTVTGTKPGLTPVVRVTASGSAPIANGTQVLQPTPTITGTPRAGSASTGVPGTWDSGTTRTYQWLVDGTPVDGATTTSYTPTLDQIGKALTFQVTSKKTAYDDVVKTSAPSTIVGLAQTLTPKPTITGTPKVDVVLAADPGTWDDGTTLAYQWFADGDAVDGATGSTYTPGAGQAGAVITVAVTSTKAGYETATRTSDATEAVAKGDLASTPVPTITGTPKVGVALTAAPGTWDDGTELAYQWFADDEAVDGATGTTYTPGAGRVGDAITVKVTGTKAGYEPTTRTSEATEAVAKGDLASTPVPTITGTPKVGVQLTAVPGDWDSGSELAYQWFADDQAVDGATGTTYTPGPGKLGAVITVKVTGTKAGYEPVTRTSAATAAVAAGDLTATPVPTITGTPKVGVQLTAVPGTWDSGTSLAYQWFADGHSVADATGSTYTPSASWLDAVITVRVTGTKTGYQTVSKTSAATSTVAPGDQTATPTPTLGGTAKVGGTMSAIRGSWDAGVIFSYQWLSDGDPINGATDLFYHPVADDLGAAITVAVTGTKAGYTTVTKTSAPSAAVVEGDLEDTPVPTITGTPKVGVTLTAHPGTWDDGTVLTYQWLADGEPVDGATAATYAPAPGRLGDAISVTVRGAKAGYTTVARTSVPTAAVVDGDQSSTPTPTVEGEALVGETLTARPGTWDDGVSLSYAWFSGEDLIQGATGATYAVPVSQLGHRLRVEVTGARAGYTPVTRSSGLTDVVGLGDQVLTPTPTITGTAKVGSVLKAGTGTWDDGVTFSYEWLRGGTAIPGATGSSYPLVAGDLGARITVRVTGSAAGYTDASEVSLPTAAVARGTLASHPKPSISGVAKVGRTLTLRAVRWESGVKLSYRWYAGSKAIAGATKSKLKVSKAMVGKPLHIVVTATKPGYTTVVRSSSPTAKVKR
ncbi:hypothetical protein ASC77_12080 [Nocardioides sp. Root1257]|uniref:M1 family aminopeptidase n=1 Tax=unclassified Nocardioides TaxID=2615069 RepID=UPI0006F74BEC|nr:MULTISPECIES: M1 family aminopeptidase [unclassified Nocardioides]KQW49401.1 hypothetical protein ASC77_12080 [Nocardioides sp. Root1257]KRC48575.1 hypothetical protein ASE24_12085 [Nocardioides sp. Root224]